MHADTSIHKAIIATKWKYVVFFWLLDFMLTHFSSCLVDVKHIMRIIIYENYVRIQSNLLL